MDCDGEGAMSTIVTGLEWIHDNMVQPAVVLMSIGGTGTLLLDHACQSLVNAGAVVVVAAGNQAEGMQYSVPTKETNRCVVLYNISQTQALNGLHLSMFTIPASPCSTLVPPNLLQLESCRAKGRAAKRPH